MGLMIPFVAVALLLTPQHAQMPPGTSHEDHLKQMQKDDALKKRGAAAMGFDQDATAHHFRLTATGVALRLYGTGVEFFDQTWKPDDVVKVK